MGGSRAAEYLKNLLKNTKFITNAKSDEKGNQLMGKSGNAAQSAKETMPQFHCINCPRKYHLLKAILEHNNARHKVIKAKKYSAECGLCGNLLPTQADYDLHMREFHGK